MTRDYAKRAPKKTTKRAPQKRRRTATKKPSTPAWAWLLIGSLLGAFITFLVYLSLNPSSQKTSSNSNKIRKQETPVTKESIPKPRFDFYQLLKEQEVEVTASMPESTSAKPAEPVDYLLQVGSFKTAEDANKHRARVLLLNLDAWVESSQASNGNTWHRVIAGPFGNSSQLAKARSTLVSQQIDTLVLKRKKK